MSIVPITLWGHWCLTPENTQSENKYIQNEVNAQWFPCLKIFQILPNPGATPVSAVHNPSHTRHPAVQRFGGRVCVCVEGWLALPGWTAAAQRYPAYSPNTLCTRFHKDRFVGGLEGSGGGGGVLLLHR